MPYYYIHYYYLRSYARLLSGATLGYYCARGYARRRLHTGLRPQLTSSYKWVSTCKACIIRVVGHAVLKG